MGIRGRRLLPLAVTSLAVASCSAAAPSGSGPAHASARPSPPASASPRSPTPRSPSSRSPTLPAPAGLVPGSGALLAAVATASGVTPEIAGKPHEAMAALMKKRFGLQDGDASAVMVGDQPRTDGRLAERLRIPFALVDSGVTPARARGFDVPVAVRAPDFVSLVRDCLARGT